MAQSRSNWNTAVRQAHQAENKDMPGKFFIEGTERQKRARPSQRIMTDIKNTSMTCLSEKPLPERVTNSLILKSVVIGLRDPGCVLFVKESAKSFENK